MNHSLFKGKKMWLIIASCVCVLAVSAGITAAYFISTTETLVNEFDPSKVTCEVVETFDGNVKKDVAIRNTGNVNAYIRASVLINWVDEQNSITVVTHLRECRKCCEGTLHRAYRRHDADWRDIQVDEGLDEA